MPPVVEIDLASVRAARVLGRGAMGTVFLVVPGETEEGEHHQQEKAYALKVFDKRAAVKDKDDALRRARWEVSVLSRLEHHHHPHLPSLLGSAETAHLLAWAVPYCPGGDLNELRHAQPDRVFSPAAVRFYAAEVVAALAALHAAGIAYRDLKPENVLLRADGHVTLTDFDLSRHLPPCSCRSSASTSTTSSSSSSPPHHQLVQNKYRRHLNRIFKRSESSAAVTTTSRQEEKEEEEQHNLAWYLNRSIDQVKSTKAKSARVSPATKRTTSFCSTTSEEAARSFSFVGTEEYVAPEVVRGDGHGFAVDWWALGILVYEMACGRTPFRGRTRGETFRNVLLREPAFSPNARRRWPRLADLVARLLEKDPARRLGFAGGADEVRAHPFFAGVDWEMLGEVSRPPYIPPPADDDDGGVVVGCEGFGVAEYFDKIHQAQAPPSPADRSPEAEEELLPEF
ncbi:hypothetical protein QOZ80_6BG0492920 [Eleusine coracana subsp. coracana]|nr:hypothetical protein QOZ80_6BG0492920 [Eleusine coracana subsp. coracana]